MSGAFQSSAFAADAFQIDVSVGVPGIGYGSGGSGGGKKLDWGSRRKRREPALPVEVPAEIRVPVPEYALAPRSPLPAIPADQMLRILAGIGSNLEFMARLRAERDDEAAAEKLLLH